MTEVSTRTGLHRLLYYSAFSPRFPRAVDDQDVEVGDIIRASIRNNRQVAITGLLLVHQKWFVQALEGPAEAVMTTYNRILSDPRHQDAAVIVAGPAPGRQFSNWNMCARRLSTADDAIVQTLELKGAFDPRKLTPVKALTLLVAVKNIQHRTLSASLN